jgi:hypothetical protein
MSEPQAGQAASSRSGEPGPGVAEETPVPLVGTVPFMRIRSVPASTDPQEEPPLRRAIRAGLLDAGVRGQAVAVLWARS